MPNYGHKVAVYEAIPRAYAAASNDEQLPALREIAYALRRITGLGDELSMDYLLEGRRRAHQRLPARSRETAGWDVVRDARGAFIEPHTGMRSLGTLDVRNC